MLASEIALEHTLDFIKPYIKNPNIRFLEVGSGHGHLAFLLSAQKILIKAIDTSKEAIASARSKGVDAIEADFLEYEDGPFDIVFFSRSLHHRTPLDKTISKAYSLLKTNGVLLVEDFAAEQADENSIAWLKEKSQNINIDCKFDSLDHWREHHFIDHQIADSKNMTEAIEKVFAERQIQKNELAPIGLRIAANN